MITEPLAVIDGQLNPAMTFDVRAPAAQVGYQIVVKGCLGVSEQGCGGRCPTDKLETIVYLLQKDPRSFLETVLWLLRHSHPCDTVRSPNCVPRF